MTAQSDDEPWLRESRAYARKLYEDLRERRKEECRLLLGDATTFEALEVAVKFLKPGRMEGNALRDTGDENAWAASRAQDHAAVYFGVAVGTQERLGHEAASSKWLRSRDKAVKGVWRAIASLRRVLVERCGLEPVATRLQGLESAYNVVLDTTVPEGRIDWDANRVRALLHYKRPAKRPKATWRSLAYWTLIHDAGITVEEAEGILSVSGLAGTTPEPKPRPRRAGEARQKRLSRAGKSRQRPRRRPKARQE